MGENEGPLPLYRGDESGAPPHLPVGNRLLPKRHNRWHGGITHTHIDENPVIRGHDLCFDKTCQENCLAICAVLVEKNGSNNDCHGMMLCYQTCQQIRFVQILFSLRWYVELILQSWTLSLCLTSSMKYSEEEPALQCRRQNCALGSSSLKPSSGASERVRD